jgi:hypothetical protein
MTSLIVHGGVLQIHSNTDLNYKFVPSLTSQTRQYERLRLRMEVLQREDEEQKCSQNQEQKCSNTDITESFKHMID